MLYNQAPVRHCELRGTKQEATEFTSSAKPIQSNNIDCFVLLPALQSQFLAMTANAAACAIFKVFTPPH